MITDAQANAVTAVANTTSKVIDVVHDVGGWLDKTVGTIPANLLRVGGGDWLAEVTKRNLARMQAKTARLLDGIERERLSEPSPSVVLPLLQAAQDESREDIQDLWAALFANALVDRGKGVRRSFFDAVQQMEPDDAIMLDIIETVARRYAEAEWGPHPEDVEFMENDVRRIAERRGLNWLAIGVSIEHLHKLGCVADPTLTTHPTPFGMALLQACRPPGANPGAS